SAPVARRRERADPPRPRSHNEDVEPPVLVLLVDLALADEEARVQPAPSRCLGGQLEPGEDRPSPRRVLLDALAMDRDEEVVARTRGDRSPEVRRPDAILPPPRVVRPDDGALEVAAYRPAALTEAHALLAPVRPVPARHAVAHRDAAERLESHGLRLGRLELAGAGSPFLRLDLA